MKRKILLFTLVFIAIAVISCYLGFVISRGRQNKQLQNQVQLNPQLQLNQIDIADQVLLQLEKDMIISPKREEIERLYKSKLPGNDLHVILFRGQMRLIAMNFRDALSDYKMGIRLYPVFVEPHLGLALTYYELALSDMLSRGRCQIGNIRSEEVPHALDSKPYLTREIISVAHAGGTFRTVETILKQAGFNKEQIDNVGTQALYLRGSGGLSPTPKIEHFVFPVADFKPDAKSATILKLSENEFKEARKCTDHIVNRMVIFSPEEMRIYRTRINELIALSSN